MSTFNLDERIEARVDNMFTRRQMQLNAPYRKTSLAHECEEIKQLIRDVLEQVKPKRTNEAEGNGLFERGWDTSIDTLEQNIREIGL